MSQYSNKDFVKAWVTCKTVQEVADKFEITKANACVKANTLHKKGVRLPKKEPQRDTDSVESLNKIVDKYTTQKVEPRYIGKPKEKTASRWSM